MGSAGRGFRGRGGGPGFRGGRGGGGRFGGRGMGRRDSGHGAEPAGPRDPRSLVSYIDVDAPKVWKTFRCIVRGGYEASMPLGVWFGP